MRGARDLPLPLRAAFLPPEDATRDDEPGEPARRLRFRAIFISDLHLGTPGCQAGPLLDFLRRTESDRLYLVGDIVDGWQLKRRWYWHQAHNDVVQKLLRKARKGCEVVYVPGNHDEAARPYAGLAFGGISIAHEAVHVTAKGERLLVVHGDMFDTVVRCARWLALLGDALYTFLLRLNRPLNAMRAHLGLPFWSLSRFAKLRVKNAVNYIGAFEEALAREASERGFDGIVCGHIHHAEIRRIGGIVYANDGDWVESLTALAETMDGELRILHWRDVVAATSAPEPVVVPAAAGLVAAGN
jgi:UDP-2,3-diacylglucosamine pyrophosphatase LpxH